ncbi:MAG: hypothetical protein ACRDHN_01260 [Thermomicrobiales bacterium]
MALNRDSQPRVFAARDLYMTAAVSATMVIVITLTTMSILGNDRIWTDAPPICILFAAMFGAAFGTIPTAVLGVGALSAMANAAKSRPDERLVSLGLGAVTVGSIIPGLVMSLALSALIGAGAG